MPEVNYKQKYLSLKAQYMNAVDLAFRLGYEQGAQQAQVDQAAQQQQQQEEMAAQQGVPQDGQPSEQPQEAEGQAPESANPAGSELDQYIAKLEGMLGKSEGVNTSDLQKAVQEMKTFQKSQKLAADLKKPSAAISGIAKALHKPAFKIGQQASHNMSDSAKRAVTMQEQIVQDIMKSWSEEEKKAAHSIENLLSVEGVVKG